ncbi:hypothetical protein HI914_05643 [Erysiphe necator]|nr:hypothetical protein HI914_05643 [Erysiphe necator]
MARRRIKKRTHIGANNGNNSKHTSGNTTNNPKSMVIRIGAGEIGPSVSQLVKDVRQMMEPDTAARLKERRSNRLRDYLSMSGPLGVTHLMLFSRSELGNTNLRIAITPRGPTLHFHVENYSLCKDIRKALRHPKGKGKEFITAPLLVMNNFKSSTDEANTDGKIPKHLEALVTTIFQSLFKPILPQSTPLSSIKRVMLLDREPVDSQNEAYILNLRHYAITTKSVGLSKPLRRLKTAEKLISSRKSMQSDKKNPPNLGKFADIADYLIRDEDDGFLTEATSGSEIDTDAVVEIAETRAKILSKRQKERNKKDEKKRQTTNYVEKRGVRLVELGPRMRLRMIKVEEGACNGKIMWHEYIHKSKEEIKALDQKWEKRRKEKEERKKIQRENIERKKKAISGNVESVDEMELDHEEWDSDDYLNDDEEEEAEEEDDLKDV